MPQLDLSRAVWRKSSRSQQNGACVEVTDLSGAVWRKSRRSHQNGACVEVTDLSGAAWRKSRRSMQNGECVEVTASLPRLVAVRDSKDPRGQVLAVALAGWRTFIADVKAGQYDLT